MGVIGIVRDVRVYVCLLQLAVFMGPVTMIPIILFSGFFLTLDAIPVYLSWVSYLSYSRYSFEGLMLSVYGNGREAMHCSQPYCHFRSPEKFLKVTGRLICCLLWSTYACYLW